LGHTKDFKNGNYLLRFLLNA